VPGNITSKASWGPNLLIKQGAKLVQEVSDILDELSSDTRRHLNAQKSLFGEIEPLGGDGDLGPARNGHLEDPMAELYRTLLRTVPTDSAMGLDTLMDLIEGWSSSEVIAGLFELEMSGQIKQLAGRRFVKVWK
jgi:DNA processing protein